MKLNILQFYTQPIALTIKNDGKKNIHILKNL